jgi:lysophospholipase L1-like esterase
MRSLLFYTLLILALPQARKIRRTALRLPVASGQPQGISGPEYGQKPLYLLHIGESTVAGVGVADLQQGFTYQLAKQLSQQLQRPVHWQAIGENGAKAQDLLNKSHQHQPADIMLITLGVNDITGLTSLKKWQADLNTLLQQVNPAGKSHVFFTQVPNMARFPALPGLLARALGLRSRMFNHALENLCTRCGAGLLLTEENFATNLMARDGYHPNAQGYARWAESVSQQMLKSIYVNKK